MDLKALREKTIAKITEDLDELTADQLRELRALESLEDPPRSTLIKAIDEKLAELAAADADPNNPVSGSTPAAPPKDDPTAIVQADSVAADGTAAPWQAKDYVGPLTGEQAIWRVAHQAQFERETITK